MSAICQRFKSPSLARWAGRWATLYASWRMERVCAVSVLTILIRIDLAAAPVAIPTMFLLYVISSLVLDLLDAWRDGALDFVLANGRQCVHHHQSTNEAESLTLNTGWAFSAVICWLSLAIHGLQFVTILALASGEEWVLSGFSQAALVWRVLSATSDMINELGRAVVIYNSMELAYLDVQVGPGARFNVATKHPEWSPLHGYRYFFLAPTITPMNEFGVNLLDGDD